MYYLKNKDIVLGKIDLDNLTFIPIENIAYLPYPLYPPDVDKTYKPTKEDVVKFCKSRVIQEDNQGLDFVLDELNWSNLNAVELCKITKCMKLDDFIWIVDIKDTESTFKNNHMRGENYSGEIY